MTEAARRDPFADPPGPPLLPPREPPGREPILNLPGAITGLIIAFVIVHVVLTMLVSPRDNLELLALFAFIPDRYLSEDDIGFVYPGGIGAQVWSFVTYAFIHGDWVHLAVNAAWLAAFGSAVARRFGVVRFLAFSAMGAAAGAGLHLALHWGEGVPVVGASAAVSAHTAAAMRFIFLTGGPLSAFRNEGGDHMWRVPALPLFQTLANPRVMFFIALWFALNVLFGLMPGLLSSDPNVSIAWEAHAGGFLAGLLLFPLFDPVRRR